MKLTTTQIGAIAENLIANELMVASNGRLSPFQPIADDDGIDVLIYDKLTGKALPIQIKARTMTLYKSGTKVRSNNVHFGVKKTTHRSDRSAHLLCLLLSKDLKTTERAWFMPLSVLPEIAGNRKDKYVVRCSKLLTTKDKYKKYQCRNSSIVAERILLDFDK